MFVCIQCITRAITRSSSLPLVSYGPLLTLLFTAHRKCTLNRDENRDFQALRSNRINVSCECHQPGHEWSSRFGLCVDVNECTRGAHNCTLDAGESCLNLHGRYTCVCRIGYVYSSKMKRCVYSSDFDKALKGDASEPKAAKAKGILDEIIRTVTRSAEDSCVNGNHIYILLILITLLYNTYKFL